MRVSLCKRISVERPGPASYQCSYSRRRAWSQAPRTGFDADRECTPHLPMREQPMGDEERASPTCIHPEPPRSQGPRRDRDRRQQQTRQRQPTGALRPRVISQAHAACHRTATACPICWPMISPETTSSTRRFCWRPAAVSFEATGWLFPNPLEVTDVPATPSFVK